MAPCNGTADVDGASQTLPAVLTVQPEHWPPYLISCVLAGLAIRAIVCGFTAWECKPRGLRHFVSLYSSLYLGRGCHATRGDQERVRQDYLLPGVIGVAELLAYPILLRAGVPVWIAAWLAFKTVYRPMYANAPDRGPFNRYLAANALVLIAAWTIATRPSLW